MSRHGKRGKPPRRQPRRSRQLKPDGAAKPRSASRAPSTGAAAAADGASRRRCECPTATPQRRPRNPHPVPKPTWKASSAASEFAFTDDDKTLLAGKTADERAADRALADPDRPQPTGRAGHRREGQKLKPGEDKELADLRALKDRVETTNRALKRKDVEQIIDASGQGTVASWFGDIKKGTFLGIEAAGAQGPRRPTDPRRDRAGRPTPTVNPDKKSATDLGVALKMYASTSDLRQPAKAIGGSSLSMHTFGLAVDLNYKGNPFIGNAGEAAPDAIRRATSLVHGTPTNVTTPLGDAKASYTAPEERIRRPEDVLLVSRPGQPRCALTKAVNGYTALKDEPADLPGWQKQIETDYLALKDKGDFKKHKPPEEGFLDLDESVVLALTGTGLTWGGTYGGPTRTSCTSTSGRPRAPRSTRPGRRRWRIPEPC